MTCTPTIITWGDPSIAWIATHLRHPWLDPFMHAVSHLGEAGPILLMFSLGYWFWRKRDVKYLAYGMFASILVNIVIKGYFMECRPPMAFWLEYNLDLTKSFSFPSGHAQATIVVWTGLAYYLRSKWLSPLCLLIGILVGISRPYLGVHYPHDVLAAWFCGLSVLGLALLADKKDFYPIKNLAFWAQIACCLILMGICQLLIQDPTTLCIRTTSALFGFWLGSQLESRYLHYMPPKNLLSVMIQILIGLGGILFLWKGINKLNTVVDQSVMTVQYIMIGWWITYGAPAIFKSMLTMRSYQRFLGIKHVGEL